MIARLKAVLGGVRGRGATAIAAVAFAALAQPVSAAGQSAEEAVEPPAVAARSEGVRRVAQWVASSDDNGELPYMIIDKHAATVFVFDAEGEAVGEAPVLIGIAEGDEATPGVGAKSLAELGPAEKTTPAGRFVAKYGRSVGRQKVLWVDYATSVALHAVVTGNKKERRRERLLSFTPEDNRITFGCINVPTNFYDKRILPLFEEDGGIVYVLPDSKPIEEVFPRLLVQPFIDSGVL